MVPCMALTAHMVTIDCVDPTSLAEFWSQALGYVQVADLGGYLILRPADAATWWREVRRRPTDPVGS